LGVKGIRGKTDKNRQGQKQIGIKSEKTEKGGGGGFFVSSGVCNFINWGREGSVKGVRSVRGGLQETGENKQWGPRR